MVCQALTASLNSNRRILSIESRLRRVGVIVESEDIHREAYNAAFAHFKACIPGQQGNIEWSEEFYDELQNKVGGGKAKMRWFFGNDWPQCLLAFLRLTPLLHLLDKQSRQQRKLVDWHFDQLFCSGAEPIQLHTPCCVKLLSKPDVQMRQTE